MKASAHFRKSVFFKALLAGAIGFVAACAPFKTNLQDYAQEEALTPPETSYEEFENYEDQDFNGGEDQPHVFPEHPVEAPDASHPHEDPKPDPGVDPGAGPQPAPDLNPQAPAEQPGGPPPQRPSGPIDPEAPYLPDQPTVPPQAPPTKAPSQPEAPKTLPPTPVKPVAPPQTPAPQVPAKPVVPPQTPAPQTPVKPVVPPQTPARPPEPQKPVPPVPVDPKPVPPAPAKPVVPPKSQSNPPEKAPVQPQPPVRPPAPVAPPVKPVAPPTPAKPKEEPSLPLPPDVPPPPEEEALPLPPDVPPSPAEKPPAPQPQRPQQPTSPNPQQPKNPPAGATGCENSGTLPCFPIAGPAVVHNDFGASRGAGTRKHAGNDLMAKKMVPVVAIDDGTIDVVRSNAGIAGTYVAILHAGGLRSVYMHLNNDTPGTDDGRGAGIAPGIRAKLPVKKGQLIGWVGDSGNAESTSPHVHFELQRARPNAANGQRSYVPINPYKMLKDAEKFKVNPER